MITIYPADACPVAAPVVATIGFFDGVHRGHAHLVDSVVSAARSMPGARSMVITFDRHPRHVLSGDTSPKLLTTLDEKLELFSQYSVDYRAVLRFDETLAAMSAREFMRSVLFEKLGVRKLIVGYDHRFGRDRSESFTDYVTYGRELGIDVVSCDALVLDGLNVSSSVIRSMLAEGDVVAAERCLGRPYFLSGRVVGGHKVGREIGFPTANIEVADETKLIPAAGVYAVMVTLEGSSAPLGGMMNIGTRPTFGGRGVTLEVNVFDFSGDLYGRFARVSFVGRLRDERKFASAAELSARLRLDREQAFSLLRDKLE